MLFWTTHRFCFNRKASFRNPPSLGVCHRTARSAAVLRAVVVHSGCLRFVVLVLPLRASAADMVADPCDWHHARLSAKPPSEDSNIMPAWAAFAASSMSA